MPKIANKVKCSNCGKEGGGIHTKYGSFCWREECQQKLEKMKKNEGGIQDGDKNRIGSTV